MRAIILAGGFGLVLCDLRGTVFASPPALSCSGTDDRNDNIGTGKLTQIG